MVVAHNMYAENAQRQYSITSSNKKKSTEKLSSGYKINRAADDAAGLSISEKMRKQIRGLNRGTENMQDGVSWLQIGDGAINEVHSILQRMNELSVQGANGTLSKSDREAIDAEVQNLKTEINRINETTKFNEMRIFSLDDQVLDDNGDFIVKDLDKMPDDLKIFNAIYDDATGKVTYGGIVFHGDRVTWDSIDPDMVYIDPTDGKQKFKEGTWEYTDSQDRTLTISAKEGDEVPTIKRTFEIMAGSEGLYIDGELVSWREIKNESGDSMTDSKYVNGTWYAEYHGATLAFEVVDAYNGREGLVSAVNRAYGEGRCRVYANYVGSSTVQAVDAELGLKNLRISDSAARMLVAGKTYTIGADAGGVWLNDGDGIEIPGSKKTWADMGIDSWDSGTDINETLTYQYSDTDGVNDTYIEFEYTLSDITSVDSVIDGLNGVKLNCDSVVSKYGAMLKKNGTYDNVKAAALNSSYTTVSLKNEVDLGRDFERQTQTFDAGLAYDSTASTASLSYGAGSITYKGSTSGIETRMKRDLAAYGDSVLSAKIEQALAGISGGSYTSSYAADTQGTYTLNLSSASNGSRSLSYTYDYADYADQIQVEMRRDDSTGQYVKTATGAYEPYDSTNAAHMGKERFNVQVSYGGATGSGTSTTLDIGGTPMTVNIVGDADKAKSDYVSRAISEMAGESTISLMALDYTRANYSGNEKPNVAVDSVFDTVAIGIPGKIRQDHVKWEESVQIQKSGDTKNKLIIPRFSLNTAVLGLKNTNCLTEGDCRNAIDMVGRALARVSTRRSLYGAMQNRLEHAIASNDNTEENTTASESRIRDTDMAEEMVNYSKQSILEQVGQSMITQANQQNQGVLALLQ